MTMRGSLLAAALALGGWLGVGSTADAQFYFQGTFGNRVQVGVQVGSPFVGGGFFPGPVAPGPFFPGAFPGGFDPSFPPPPAIPGPVPPPPPLGGIYPAVPAYGGYSYPSAYPTVNVWRANFNTYPYGYYR